MKKTTVSLLCLLFTLLLCACTVKKAEPLNNVSSASTTQSLTVKITIPEGYTSVQIAQRLEENAVCSAEEFMKEVNDIEKLSGVYKFINYIDSDKKAFALEGYIFPDTYEFFKGESAASALSRFLKNTDKKLIDEYYVRAQSLGYSIDEIITLASIVQSEAGFPNENAKVSSVLHNRIESAGYGKLQCDVTINYVNEYIINSKYLSEDTEQYKMLYNTYKCDGLPAGAICNPGLDCIKAALYPADTGYFFFVTDEDKNYYYAETYQKHLENCKLCGITG